MPNSFLDWLEDEPKVGYATYLQGAGGPPGLQRYFGNRFEDIWGQYQGALGQQVLAGQEPTQKWTDFLIQNPFTARYAGLSPEQRGETMSRFNPWLRWLL